MKTDRFQRGWVLVICLLAWAVAMRESFSRREIDPIVSEDAVALPAALSSVPAAMNRISIGSPAPSVHSASAVELPDGTIRAFWFGGSREGASDVSIWAADFDGETWSLPRVAVARELIARRTGHYIRKLGNPVAHASADGRVHLFVVSVSLGGWSGSAINRVVFASDGSVESVNRLVASPLLNLGTLVRGAALEMGSGEILLPAYHETVKKFPLLLRVGSDGRVLGRGGPKVRGDLFQPWMLASEGCGMDLFLRSGEGTLGRVYHSHKNEAPGSDWSDPSPLPVANPNSGISALRLSGGDFLLAANPDPDSRENLVLLRASATEGPWNNVFTVDSEDRDADEMEFKSVEYSYPWLMMDRSGVIHLFYTWNRCEIRHWRIGQDELSRSKGGGE